MTLPKLHYISQGATTQEHLDNIQKACSSGAELVQLGLNGLSEAVFLAAAKEARTITEHFQTRLILNDNYKVAKEVKADGVLLSESESCPLDARVYLGDYYFIGGKANTLEECQKLLEKGVNYIYLQPFQLTSSTQNLTPVLGFEEYQAILEQVNTEKPIFASGGITLKDVPELMTTGIYGIAASKAITSDFNSISKLHALLKGTDFMEEVWKNNSQE